VLHPSPVGCAGACVRRTRSSAHHSCSCLGLVGHLLAWTLHPSHTHPSLLTGAAPWSPHAAGTSSGWPRRAPTLCCWTARPTDEYTHAHTHTCTHTHAHAHTHTDTHTHTPCSWDKQRLAEESANPVLLVSEADRPGTAPTKHLKPDNVRTRPLPLYRCARHWLDVGRGALQICPPIYAQTPAFMRVPVWGSADARVCVCVGADARCAQSLRLVHVCVCGWGWVGGWIGVGLRCCCQLPVCVLVEACLYNHLHCAWPCGSLSS